jgi:hypothetical protein
MEFHLISRDFSSVKFRQLHCGKPIRDPIKNSGNYIRLDYEYLFAVYLYLLPLPVFQNIHSLKDAFYTFRNFEIIFIVLKKGLS